jgi:hypothetical protein
MCACATSAGSLHATAECEDSTIKLLTTQENPSLDASTAVIVASGPITTSMTEDLLRLSERVKPFDTLILDLDSPGGRLDHAEELVAALQSIRDNAKLKTYVRHGSHCLSACALVFQRGDERIAGGASVWLFHAACPAFSRLPMKNETQRFIDLMIAGGASKEFLSSLVDKGYLSLPGEFWTSGYELFHVYKANIITTLLDPWRPIRPELPQPD